MTWVGEENMLRRPYLWDLWDWSPGFYLRVKYREGSINPNASKNGKAPSGGANFYARPPWMEPSDSLHLRYDVRFASGFKFVKGGKLPGLFGCNEPWDLRKKPQGTSHGGEKPDGKNGFSTRYMWRADGLGEVYAYKPKTDESIDKEYGESIPLYTSNGKERLKFKPGKWYCLEQRVKLNTPNKPDGEIQVWVNDDLALDQKRLTFRYVDSLKIQGIFFSTFFGGHGRSWASASNTYADFARFAISKQRIGPR
jgi:hypothetical protein